MMKFNRLSVLFAVAATLGATGCASTAPAPANKAMSVQQISEQYKQGNELVKKGEKVRLTAQQKIDAAKQDMKEGDALVSRGKTLMAESEQAFRDTSKAKN
jgi:FlaG/FlaF family flagellin (archaellin)